MTEAAQKAAPLIARITAPRTAVAWIIALLLVAALYLILARLGLLLDPVGGFASVVWAPTGLAIAALAILGYRAAPAVWAGALTANMLSGAPALVAGSIALGNTLEAVVAVAALSRVPGFRHDFGRLSDVLAFGLVALSAPVVSATIGVGSLVLGGQIGGGNAGAAWLSWWVGDCIGALLVAPALLVWVRMGVRDMANRWREAALLLVALVAVASLAFIVDTSQVEMAFLRSYFVFPLLVWAALRFETRGAVTAVLLTSVIAVLATARAEGPFQAGSLRDSLFALQTFMGMLAVSVLSLAAAVREREEASQQVRELLTLTDAANQAKSDFLAAMSHELRTPLNAIGGHAEILSLDVHGSLTERQRDAVTRIMGNQRHLAALVDDILSFTRVETGRLKVQLTEVPVAELIASLEQFTGPEAARRQVSITALPVDAGLVARGDAERIRQILLNLVMNAMKFSAAGQQVRIAADQRGANVEIVVRDQGIGIPADKLEQVFEPFFQVERGNARRYPGLGLGLTISRDLARAMAGDVTVANGHGGGTVATLTLPRA